MTRAQPSVRGWMSPSGRWTAVLVLSAAMLSALVIGCRDGHVSRMAKAVAGGDRGEITRAFHDAVYDRWARMSASVPVIRGYLTHPDPYVRYTAARYLYVAGDSSGYATLVELVRAPQPVVVRYNVPREVIEAAGTNQEDIRVSAASVLGKYRQRESAQAIQNLFDSTPTGRFELAGALMTLGVKLMPADTMRFAASAITDYGIVGARRFVPELIATFEHPHPPDLANTPELRVISAWALAELTGEDRYVEYLVTAAKEALTPDAHGRLNYVKVTTALKYLGCLQRPPARPVLEDALDSGYFAAVEVAVVNLLFNQKDGSEKARQLLLRQLHGERPRLMQATVLLDVASSFDDPEIQAAGRVSDHGDQREWYQAAVERRNWPIYNWIDDYVVKLNHPLPDRVRSERVLGERG